MMRPSVSRLALTLTFAVIAFPAFGQKLHTNSQWDQCAIVLDATLTQAAWHQFVTEMGIVTYFRPLISAKPLGRKNVEIGLLNAGTRIHDEDAAWNDTFSHPDSLHWLFEGSTLYIPGVMARAGVTDRVDVGAYFTKAVGANYGVVGVQVQYNVLNDSKRHLAAAGRISAVRLYGPDDVKASTYGLDFVVSRDVSVFAPYVGVSGYLARGQETTSKVNLQNENVFGAQAMAGVAARVSFLRLGAEFEMAKKPGTSMKIAFAL